jgi:hypothetical protein
MMATRTPSSKRDDTAKLATAFATRMSVKEVDALLQVSELEASNLIVRGKYLAAQSKAVAAVQGDVA